MMIDEKSPAYGNFANRHSYFVIRRYPIILNPFSLTLS